jgi:serine protease
LAVLVLVIRIHTFTGMCSFGTECGRTVARIEPWSRLALSLTREVRVDETEGGSTVPRRHPWTTVIMATVAMLVMAGLGPAQAANAGYAATEPMPVEAGGSVTVRVDPVAVTPRAPSLSGFSANTTRPLASLADAAGVQVDFVADELILGARNGTELKAFLDRWRGEVVAKLETKGWTTQYLVRVDASRADPSQLSGHLARLNPDRNRPESLVVSSQSGLQLLSAAAEEASHQMAVGVNWINEYYDYDDRSTREADVGPDGFGNDPATPYSANAYQWSYLNSGSVQNIGVTEAWTLLDSVGRLDNKVKIGIVDQGFRPLTGNDLPQWAAYSPFWWVDPLEAGPSGSPWHGTHSASAAAAVPDNFRGAAGPAGPVAQLSLVYTYPDFFLSMQSISLALETGAKVINLSFGSRVPWPLAWTVLPFDGYTAFLRAANDILLIAAAGNDGENVDATTGFLGLRWESYWNTPCENSGVLCVGGLSRNSRSRHPFSNYGPEDVDIFAPFHVLVGPDPANSAPNAAYVALGTSVASPYTAGVAALIWAANPDLSADGVEDALLRAMTESPDSTVGTRVINALDAIREALPAVINIASPDDGETLPSHLGTEFRATTFDDGHGTPVITWTRDGIPFGIGNAVLAQLPPGPRIVRATAAYPDGTTATDVVRVQVVNHPPTVHVSAPRNADGSVPVVGQSELIAFHATSLDDAGPLPDSQVSWHLDGASASFATGHNPVANTGGAPGPHTVTIRGCDGFGVCATDSVPIMIQPDTANQPPTVRITNPSNGAVLWVNGNEAGSFYHELTLDGDASDPEGGPLSLVWLDNGTQIATGASPTVRLQGGCGNATHTLTLRATDNAGHARQDQVEVTVALVC